MTPPVALAVIGCGDVAMERHLPTIATNRSVRLAAVCDTVSERANAAAARFGAERAVSAPEAIFADPAIDAVIVATPPWVTPRLTIAALRAGKDVLCEKPMALTLTEAAAVRAEERQTDRFVQVGFVLRHGPMFGTLRRWIAEDRLGSPLSLRIAVFDETYDPAGNPEHYQRIMATLAHGAPCIHDGAHTADHLHYLLGTRATRLMAWGQKTRPEFPRPNYNGALIAFEGGHQARVEIGWFLPTFPPSEWSIIGPKGLAVFRQADGEVVLETTTGTERVRPDEAWIPSCFRYQLERFVLAIRTRVSPEPGSRAGLDSLALCLAFERALDQPLAVQEVVPQ